MAPTASSSVCVEMTDSAILRMEAVPVAWGGQGSTVRKHVLLVTMAQTANSIAHVRMVVFAAGFLGAVSAPKGSMDQAVNTNALLDFMVLIVLTPVTAKMEPVVM